MSTFAEGVFIEGEFEAVESVQNRSFDVLDSANNKEDGWRQEDNEVDTGADFCKSVS